MKLETERLVLTKYTAKHFGLYFQLAGDELVMKMITGKSLTADEAYARFQKMLAVNEQHSDFGYYMACTKTDLQQVGLGKLTLTEKGEAEIGYMLAPDEWGKGYGTEISNGMIAYARTFPQLDTLMAIIDPENKASRKILENAGFALDEVRMLNDLPAEIYRMALKTRQGNASGSN